MLVERIKILKENKWIFRSIIKTIWFNFHYLPFKQALKIPIVLYKPKIISAKGTIKINGPIHTGMIQLGKPNVFLYSNNGIMFENWGGVLEFNGKCIIGNSSALSIGNHGNLRLGYNFRATCALKLACYYGMEINDNVLLGWDCTLTDSDFHILTKQDGTTTTGYGRVLIGENTWMAMKCIVLKNSVVPANSVLSACTLYSGNNCKEEKVIISTNIDPYVKANGIYRDELKDRITYK